MGNRRTGHEPVRNRLPGLSPPKRLGAAPPSRRWRASEQCRAAIRRAIRQIPRGKVATYAQVAAAAGYPLYHRQVVQVLRQAGDSLPWQRVVGAGGEIRLKREMADEQRLRLQMEGVRFRGRRVAMEEHRHTFHPWEIRED